MNNDKFCDGSSVHIFTSHFVFALHSLVLREESRKPALASFHFQEPGHEAMLSDTCRQTSGYALLFYRIRSE